MPTMYQAPDKWHPVVKIVAANAIDETAPGSNAIQHGQYSARLQNPSEFSQTVRTRDTVAQPECHRNYIKAPIGKWEPVHICLQKRNARGLYSSSPYTRAQQFLSGSFNHTI